MAIYIYNIRWVANCLAFLEDMNRRQHNWLTIIIHLRCSRERSSRFLHPLLLCNWAVQFSGPELLRTAEAEDSFPFSEESEVTLLLTYSVQAGGATLQYPKILSLQKNPVFVSDLVVSFLTTSISRPSLLMPSLYHVSSFDNIAL